MKVTGKVQGVFFRQSTADQARMLGLTGWVANQNDGSVKVEAQGPEEQLESLIIWCKKGPPSARVDDVEVVWIEQTELSYSRFEILRY